MRALAVARHGRRGAAVGARLVRWRGLHREGVEGRPGVAVARGGAVGRGAAGLREDEVEEAMQHGHVRFELPRRPVDLRMRRGGGGVNSQKSKEIMAEIREKCAAFTSYVMRSAPRRARGAPGGRSPVPGG